MNEIKKTCSGIVLDENFQRHLTGGHHPEKPSRIIAIENLFRNSQLIKDANIIKPRLATFGEVALCHTAEYIRTVREEVENCAKRDITDGSYTLVTGDVQICPASYEVALLAVGGVLEAVDAVLKSQFSSVFCLTRPPGHHACSNRGMGFCIFNNVAIGARYAQKKYGLEKILIADWDVHHGNGTQEIFENDPSVFYFSTHQWPLYPGTGSADEKGVGNILNCPIAAGSKSRFEVIHAFQNELCQAMESFKPDAIFISAGFDAHYMDPLGGMNLTEGDFGELTRILLSLSEQYAKGRIISVLEGGYDLTGLSLSCMEHYKVLSNR